MHAKTIRTDAGQIKLIAASIEELRGIAYYWPMELFAETDKPGHYGLVFQHGDKELHGIKLQPVDMPSKEVSKLHMVHRIMIAAALPHYVKKGPQGVILPCAYYREKDNDMMESGIAMFLGPDPASKLSSEDPDKSRFDNRLGEGATAMILDMIGQISNS